MKEISSSKQEALQRNMDFVFQRGLTFHIQSNLQMLLRRCQNIRFYPSFFETAK